MKLYELLKGVTYSKLDVDNVEIKSICTSSKEVTKDSVYIAMKGDKLDGNDFVDEAISNGASVIISEKESDIPNSIKVDNIRRTYSIMSANFYNNPARKLKIIAVVGTNGKSSSAYFTYQILKYNGYKVALIGTGQVLFDNVHIRQDMTTPDPINLHSYFRMMVDSGVEYVVMEVSAHAIYLEKMYGIKCEMGLFTNFSQDHLDFFKTLDIYKRVKMSFFNSRCIKVGIVNCDDKCGQEIIERCNVPTFSYGLDNPSDVFAIDIEYCIDKTRFVVNMLDEISHFATEIVGRYNVYNILGASLVARLFDIPMYGIRDAVYYMQPLRGRYERIKSDRADFIIDYAHTQDAMKNVLSETRKLYSGKIYAVFGCGGNRDKAKRPMMGKVALSLADAVVLTSDNSRNERTTDIIADILRGNNGENAVILPDRYDAIKYAYEMTNKGDVVLVMGKGHEEYQDNGNGKIYYSDHEAIIDIIRG